MRAPANANNFTIRQALAGGGKREVARRSGQTFRLKHGAVSL